MRPKQLSIYLAKLLAGLALSTTAWLALPVEAGDRTVTAVQTAKHKTRMDDSQDLKDDLRDALGKCTANAGSGCEATSAQITARKLLELARKEEKYWLASGISAAITLAHQSVSAAEAMLRTAPHPDTPDAREAFANLEQNCRSCHDLHPEKLRDAAPLSTPH